MQTSEPLKIRFEHFSLFGKEMKIPVALVYCACLLFALPGGVIPVYIPEGFYSSFSKVFGKDFISLNYLILLAIIPAMYWFFFMYKRMDSLRYAVFASIHFLYLFFLQFFMFLYMKG